MTKNKEFKEVLGILEDVYGWNDTNELTDIQAELVNDVISVVKNLAIPDVVLQSEQLCEGLHSTDFNGKCFKCGEQVFIREPK